MPQVIEVPGQGPVEFPDGMTDEQIVAAIKKTSSPSIGDRAARVAGLGARSLISGVTAIPTLMAEGVAAPLRALSGGKYFPSPSATLQQGLTNAGLPEPANAAERLSTGITSAMAGGGATQLAARAAQPVSQVGQGVRDLLLQQPGRQTVAAGTGAAASGVAGELGAGPVGQMAAGVAGGMVPFAPQMVRGLPTPEVRRQAAIANESMDAGLKLPPTQASGGNRLNAILEGWIGGKAPTDRLLSLKNQPQTNALIKKDLGISDDAAITTGGLREIRLRAGNDYDAIRAQPPFKSDQIYADQIKSLGAEAATLAKEIPDLANKDILRLTQSLQQPQLSGATVIAATRKLRTDATAAYRSGSSDLGRFYKGAADALEDLVERNLEARGVPDLLDNFKKARTTIAKAHTVEAALSDSGNVDAKILASQFDKGSPMSGNMKKVARAANLYGPAMRLPETVGEPAGRDVLGYYLAAMGAGGAAATGNPAWLAGAVPATRPVVRSLMTSRPYQEAMVRPVLNPLPRKDAAGLGILSGAYSW